MNGMEIRSEAMSYASHLIASGNSHEQDPVRLAMRIENYIVGEAAQRTEKQEEPTTQPAEDKFAGMPEPLASLFREMEAAGHKIVFHDLDV